MSGTHVVRTRFCAGMVAAILILLLGCSGGSVNNPVTPGISPESHSASTLFNTRVVWGMWNVIIDPETLTAMASPIRGSEFTANVTRFMQPPMSPTNMVSFTVDSDSQPADGYFVVYVNLRHPFPGMSQYNGFDVRGILMADGTSPGLYDPTVLHVGPGDTRLVNADGYTRWWNWQEFTYFDTIFGATQGKLAPPYHPNSMVNGYKYFCDSLEADDEMKALDPASRGFFETVPGINHRRYEIQFKMDGSQVVFNFNYAVDASWDQPDPAYAPNYPIEAFPLTANCQEAYDVEVMDAGSTAYYVDDGDNGGFLVLDIEVFDWQGGANGYVPAEVAGLYLEGEPLSDVVDVLADATILTGSTVCSSVYEVTINGLNLSASGDFELFGTVENSDPNTFEPQVPGGSTWQFPDSPLAAYFLCTVHVSDEPAGDPPVVTGIDPDHGIPDCTEEHVRVLGEDFVDGATFRLERDGYLSIEATNVEFVDETILAGDLDLLNAESGLWDVTVENPSGMTGTLEDGFTVVDAIYVDGDNASDPSKDGTMEHPFSTIQAGVDAAYASDDEPVIVDQSTNDYSPFTLRNNSHVIGCNWNDGVGWPTVSQTNQYTYGSSVNNVTVEGLFFDITINNGDTGMHFNSGNGINFIACKFSGVINVQSGRFLRFQSSQNINISYSWFTEIYQHGPDAFWRYLYALYCGSTTGVIVHHCEFSDIGYDIYDSGQFGTSIDLIRVGYETTAPHDVDFHNILIYNIYNKTDCIRPSPNPDPQNAVSIFSLGNINYPDWVGDFKLYNITVDDIRHADTPATTTVNAGHVNGGYFGMIGGDDIVWKNNIVSNVIGTDDYVIYGNTSYYGWWVDGYVNGVQGGQAMDYSACYNICWPDLPPGENWSDGWYNGWCNQVHAGTGCIYNYENNNPVYDMSPGSTFYHPTNTDYSQGGDDGGEMGAFGGPEGDWTPPSQLE